MLKRLRVSLANKCQLLFGAAVVLILAAALTVVWLRMEALVERQPQRRARDFADAWLADQIQLGGALTPIDAVPDPLPPGADVQIALLSPEQFDQLAEDPFLSAALERFERNPEASDRFAEAQDRNGQTYFRFARAIRRSDLSRIMGGAAAGFTPGVDATGLVDPLEMILAIDLRDRDAATQSLLNFFYIVTAGLLAGVLAIGAFWFITMRLILSPVRLLRSYAERVGEGNLDIRSDINTGDEFEQLSTMFNQMLDRVRANESDLRAANKTLDLKLGELAESNVALYEANQIKGEFLANVSHELRTPLNSILGFAEVLHDVFADSEDPADDKRKRYCANIITSSRRLLDLINDLLDLAKIEAGRMELRLDAVSPTDLCEGLLNLMRPQADPRGVKLVLKLEPKLPMVQTDPGKLQQILFNFLSNAVKFTPEGGTVTLSAVALPAASDREQSSVRFSVSDTGPGIPHTDQQRIFDKFTQLDPSVTKTHGGTGLGLTISKELAEMLQARIELDSEPGSGATFSLVVPQTIRARNAALMPDLV